jgi:hypothetical protein
VRSNGVRDRAARQAARRRRRRRLTVAALLVIVLGAATARLFVWPATGMPRHVDAIVMLNGPGERLAAAEQLGWEHRASYLVVSRSSEFYGHGSHCAARIPRVKVICFKPDPATTQGEAEFAGRLAARYHWRSIVMVAMTPQDTPARIRLGRCFHGRIYVETVSVPGWLWPYEIAYEWGATIKSLVLQRSC